MSNEDVEEICELYNQLGKRWKQECQVFLWRTHSKTCKLPPRNTKTWEQILIELHQRYETITQPRRVESKENKSLEESLFEVSLFDGIQDQPIKTWTNVYTRCPLCLWEYKTVEEFTRHFPRIHTLFHWWFSDAKTIHGSLRKRVNMFQLLEYVDEAVVPFPSFVALGWKQEQCFFKTLDIQQLDWKMRKAIFYFSTMKFSKNGEELLERTKETTKAFLEQHFVENIPKEEKSGSSHPSVTTTVATTTAKRTKQDSPSQSIRSSLDSLTQSGSKSSKGNKRQSDGTYYHTVTLHPVAKDEELDSESDYSEKEWKEELELQMLEQDEMSCRTKEFFRLWNDFIRKNRVFADFQLPTICYQFVQVHSKDIEEWNLFHLWRMHLLNLFEYGLIQRADIVKCCRALNRI